MTVLVRSAVGLQHLTNPKPSDTSKRMRAILKIPELQPIQIVHALAGARTLNSLPAIAERRQTLAPQTVAWTMLWVASERL